jgi:hypothetical protein
MSASSRANVVSSFTLINTPAHLEHRIQSPDGRTLAVAQWGDPARPWKARSPCARSPSGSAFWIAGKKDLSNWDNLRLVVKWWDRMEEIVRDRGAGPWFQAISDGAIHEIDV